MKRLLSLAVLGLSFSLTACQPKVSTLPSAENMRMTTDGRLFATGSQGIYEIKKQGDTYTRARLNQEPCQHLGLAVKNDWLFSVCMTKYPGIKIFPPFYTSAEASLWAYPLNTDSADASITNIGRLEDFYIPNGMDALPDSDQLIIADENFISIGGVTLVDIDFSEEIPKISAQTDKWISKDQDVSKANGVRVIGNAIFLTDKGSIKRIDLDEAGMPQKAALLYDDKTTLDDLAPFCDGVVAVDFLKGRIVYANKDGSKTSIIQSGLFTPSSVMMNATPMFDSDAYLVTEVRRFFEGESDNAKGRILDFSKSEMNLSCDSLKNKE